MLPYLLDIITSIAIALGGVGIGYIIGRKTGREKGRQQVWMSFRP